MSLLAAAHLTLFMTRGVSLAQWDRQGLFEREVALYRALRPHLAGLSFVTYGDGRDAAFAQRLPGIEIMANRWGLPGPLYAALIPRLHRRSLERAGLLKTNQIKGAEVALAARAATGARLIARCGYMWSLAAAGFKRGLPGAWNYARAVRAERAAFTQADAVCVTTAGMKDFVAGQYGVAEARIRVIPNYVLDEFFETGSRPASGQRGRGIIFVGRLEADKNPMMVIEAARGLEASVTIIGQGSLQRALAARAAEAGVEAEFIPVVPHLELSARLRAADVFMLPSPREGHPKTLIEAMACGLAVVGTDAAGIRDVIRTEETGLLVEDSPAAFRAAAARLLADAELRAHLGRNAREFVREHFSFAKAVASEVLLLAEVAKIGSNAV